MNDVVYFLKTPLAFHEVELKYSLRSLRNIPHGKVFMVTPTLPDIVNPDSVVHVSHLPVHERKYDDLSEKWKWLGTNTLMTDNVTYMDDDYYITLPVSLPLPKLGFHPLWLMVEFFENQSYKSLGVGTEAASLIAAQHNTMRLLKEHGIEDPISPQQHFPWPVKRSNIPVDWEDGNGPYDWKIIEFNHNNPNPPIYLHECKVTNHESLVKVMKRTPAFLSSQDGITLYTSGLLTLLSMKFPEKSEYERN